MATDLVAAAIDDLYARDPAEFTSTRNALAAAARKAGDQVAAKQITALRRPTRAAWILNRLARSQPELASDFGELGGQLRDAHQALDGEQIRELTKQRRQLIDHTAAQAFGAAGIAEPSAALRDEVTATLGAVLADQLVAARFAAGALVTAEEQSGFGPVGAQLSGLPSLRSVSASSMSPSSMRTAASAVESARPGSAVETARPARAVRDERRRQAALEAADRAVTEATEANEAAESAATEAADEVRRLNEQLTDAKRREDDAMLAARHSEIQLHKAEQARRRLD